MATASAPTKLPPTKPLKALVIGGGIAGPAISLFLRRAGITSIVYESHASPTTIGGGLGLAPNGLRVLDSLGVLDKVMKYATITETYSMKNYHGKELGRFPGGSKTRNGYSSIILRRSTVHEALIEALEEEEITIVYNKKLISISETENGVKIKFEDGTESEGDLVIGCDGVKSNVRKHILGLSGKNLQLNYTGLVGIGAFVSGAALPEIDPSKEAPITMTSGPQGFVGYCYNPTTKDWMWWCNYEATKEFANSSMKTMPESEIRQQILARYGKWHEPIPSLIAAQWDNLARIPIYDLEKLPTLHSSRVVLVGDAAHPISPHAGQGVSLALEDVMLLAKFLRDYPSVEEAFVAYERLRVPRVSKIVNQARRVGSGKMDSSVFWYWIKSLFFKFFLKFVRESFFDEVFKYKIEWDKKENTSSE